MRSKDVVVGVDGSESSKCAVRWAADAAHETGGRLRIVAATGRPWPPKARFDGFDRNGHQQLDGVINEATVKAHVHQPDLEVTTSIALGDPAAALVEAAGTDGMVVVGNRGRGGFTSALFGSVSRKVATLATGPVVVVRGWPSASGPVVVGYDDSPSAERALATGFDEASRHGVKLIVVRAAREPGRALESALEPWRDKYPEVAATAVARTGSAADALTALSRGASLVIVGHRGRGAVAGAALGSTGLHLLYHAHCPVMIVRAEP